ncbi:MAG TPA: ABC transporter ATP-binding protein, partial [Acidimicrobiia bacterium]|nr:ABC transporter ATP-binding protein [Acidimicrobiia bacterium]
MDPVLGIELDRVRRSFGPQVGLAGVDLVIPQGSYVILMGPNGAGKTTLLRVMAGLATPTAGTVRIAGIDLRHAGPGLRAQVGFVSHESMLYPDLSAADNLLFQARLFGLPRPEAAVQAVAEQLDLTRFIDRRVRHLSRGMRQRTAVARALLHEPRVVLFDEPYTGLDEAAARSLARLLRSLHTPERTLVVATHELGRALTSGAQRLVVLNGGRIVF